MNLQFFKLRRSYSISFNLSHVDEISEFESERTISKVRKKKKIFELYCPTL